MNSKHMSLGGKEDWPRRRSPLPASMLYGTSPRRRKDVGSCFTTSPSPDALVPADSGSDFWDSGTITPRSWGSQAGTSGLDMLDNSSSDESTLYMQIRQQKRTINELSKQLEDREAELGRQIKLADALKASADDAHRQAQAERQIVSKHEEQLRWHEEHLLSQSEGAKKQTTAHQSALRMADRRHQAAIDQMLLRVVHAEDETKLLSARIKDLSVKLDRAKALEEQSRCANEQMSKQILETRLAAIQASQSSAELVVRLNERSVYIGQLEGQVRALLMSAPHDYMRLPTAVSTSAAFGLEPAVGDRSLHFEISKATQLFSNDRDSDVQPPQQKQPVHGLAPPQLQAYDASRKVELLGADMHTRHVGKPNTGLGISGSSSCDSHNASGARLLSHCGHGEHAKFDSSAELSASPKGILYWMAVYAHMVWALYSRLWVRPTMYLATSTARAVFGLLALGPWLRILLLFIPRRLTLAPAACESRTDKADRS
ncbi:hypothetical protein H4S07_000518 [Coemansia furcata]|uniref:Uncharacterized protein n=1 Tax=Coemansia furcata TaxID=417177 RepID=A0ACC1LR87_9FUNG|nr:hypothetical protein H4S07_000518 [Coemansia furcata]